MDPFEQTVLNLLASRRMYAQQQWANAHPPEAHSLEKPSPEAERLPYNISKHVQYVQQDAYLRKRKALKKQTDIV